MTTEELNALIAQAEGGDVSAMNELTYIYGELDGYINHEQAAKWFLALIQKDCDPNSGVYEKTGYNKNLYKKVKNAIFSSTLESALSSLSDNSSGGSLFGKSIFIASLNAKSYIIQADELKVKHVISLIENDWNGESPFRDSSDTVFIIPEGTKRIGSYAFYNNKLIKSITVPNSVTSIGNHAFDGCDNLIYINIPDSVTEIGSRAFSGCRSLASSRIPENAKSIGDDLFDGCSSLILENPNNVLYAKNTLMQINTYMSILFNKIKNACSSQEIQKTITNLPHYPELAKDVEKVVQAFSGMTIDVNPDNINKSIERFTEFLQALNAFARSVNELTLAPETYQQAKNTLMQINTYVSILFNKIKNACSTNEVQRVIKNLTQYRDQTQTQNLKTVIQTFSDMTIDENPDNINKSIERFTEFLQALNAFARSVNGLIVPQK